MSAPSLAVAARTALARLSYAARRMAIVAIRAYQSTASIRPQVCHYHPTCSEYTAQCIHRFGVVAGTALGIRRILRCNPYSPGGYDPVPLSLPDCRADGGS